VDETEQDLTKGLERLNALPQVNAANQLLRCCGSIRWAKGLVSKMPFDDFQQLLDESDSIWLSLNQEDWLEAFSSHPKIGEKKTALSESSESRQWSEDEQSGTRSASRETLSKLAELNKLYEKRFGYIFIISASGKSTDEMLLALRERLQNDPETEIQVAAEQQRLITHLRLQKLLEQ
jgi:OHCU decarboxylase